VDAASQRVALGSCASIERVGDGMTGLRARSRPSSSRLRPALSAGAVQGSPEGGTGSVRSVCRGSGHNAALPLDAPALARRRHLPGSARTGASSRGQGSGSCFQPGTGLGLGLRQVSNGPGGGRGQRGPAA
jgi:hypothetical protein